MTAGATLLRILSFVLVCLLIHPSPGWAAKREKIRVYVFTATAGPNEFVDLDQHPRTDSVKDLRRDLKYIKGIKLVDTPDEADLTLEVLNRDRVADGGTAGVAVPIFGGGAIAATQQTNKAVVFVRLSVVGRDYLTDIVGEAGGWSAAARKVGDQVKRWVKENYDRLRPPKEPK